MAFADPFAKKSKLPSDLPRKVLTRLHEKHKTACLGAIAFFDKSVMG